MTGGGNGLHPVVNLQDRQKCPAHPTKRRYAKLAEAQLAAKKSSASSKLTIEPYLCESCGQYHLTKSVGGDSIQLQDGQFSVGEFKALAPNHPVFGENPAEEPPIVPGDHATRVKFAARFLEQNPEPTSEELCIAIGGCTKETLRRVMRDLNYRNTRGRHARWVKNDPPAVESPADPEPEAEQWRGGREEPWRKVRVVENVERLRHVALGDLIETYAAAGLRLVLSVEDDDA